MQIKKLTNHQMLAQNENKATKVIDRFETKILIQPSKRASHKKSCASKGGAVALCIGGSGLKKLVVRSRLILALI